MNKILDELRIASTDGATDRDEIQALCRRDATLITHEFSRARHQSFRERKEMAKEDALSATLRKAEKLEFQRQTDEEAIRPLVNAFIHDYNQSMEDSPNALWRKASISTLKSFYRSIISKEDKLQKQPSCKLEWLNCVGPKLGPYVLANFEVEVRQYC